MKTKMTKKPLKKAQTGTTVGAEQGKGAKLLRTAGIATPIIGAIGVGIKALKDRKKKKQEAYISAKKDKKKTGGMVNPNAKASASTTATGYSGGISSAPKTALPKAQYGRAISEKAANRKVSKGKGTIAKPYPSGPDEKGSYVGFSKEARRSDSPFVSMKNSKAPRPIQKKGGVVKRKK